MSSSITQCPGCYTRFRVTTEQLTAHNGIVRCGLCSAIFNAPEHLQDDEPSPQLALPIQHTDNDSSQTESILKAATPIEPETTPTVTGSDELETLFQQIVAAEVTSHAHIEKPKPKPLHWPWMVGSLLLVLIGLVQFAYFFRVEMAAHLPGLKPALLSYCELLKCAVPLPEKLDLINIESSDLDADPQQPTIVNLSAVLHNRAEYTQAYPNIELSLTDIQDKILARRVFMPSEYLKAGEDEKLGLTSNRELNIKLHLDTAELRPTGYKLMLYYPQHKLAQ